MNKIKAIIFDLDDTLYDCSNELIPDLIKKTSDYLATKTHFTSKEIQKEVELRVKKGKALANAIRDFCDEKHIEEEIILAAKELLLNSPLNIKPLPGVTKLLAQLKEKNIKIIIVTSGNPKRQQEKIISLGIQKYIDIIVTSQQNKIIDFKQVIKKLKLKPEEIICVGDRIDKEIKAGNELGMITVRVLTGRRKDVKPTKPEEKPKYVINSVLDIEKIILRLEKKEPYVVAIGGGTGLPNMLKGMKTHTDHLTAIVAVTDSGRSTGMLREDMSIPAMGDLRNCLVALSEREDLIDSLFKYRFEEGRLEGHSFGNLFIAALTKVTGSFEQAIEETSKILNVKGSVIPATLENVHLCAELEDGTILEQENIIVARNHRTIERSKIKRVYLSKKAKANPKAITEIEQADIIIIGPGQLYTSVISPLLPEGIADAIRRSKALKIFVCNIMTVAAQTHNYSVEDHLSAIEDVLGEEIIDYVIYSNKKPPENILKAYEQEKAYLVEYKGLPTKTHMIACDAIEDITQKRQIWNKQDWLRHDPHKIADKIMEVYRKQGEIK